MTDLVKWATLDQIYNMCRDGRITEDQADHYYYFWRNGTYRFSSECVGYADSELVGEPTEASYQAWKVRQQAILYQLELPEL